jgi:aryl-alcohol dehydrogenase-like predicted oxidoreductase
VIFDFPPVERELAWNVVDCMRPLAEARGCSVARIALAWLLHQPRVTSIIIGAKRPDQLADNLAAVEIALSAKELATLDEVSRLPLEYPAWMLERQGEVRKKQLKDAKH